MWTYRIQRVQTALDQALFDAEQALDSGRDVARSSTCGVHAMERLNLYGTFIDGGGPLWGVSGEVHPDAEAVHNAVLALPDRLAAVSVVTYARLGEPPPWVPTTQKLKKLRRDGKGRAHMVSAEWVPYPLRSAVADWLLQRGESVVTRAGRSRIAQEEAGFTFRPTDDGHGREVLQRWCPLELQPSTAWIENVNGAYRLWHGGMMALLAALIDKPLRDHAVQGFRAPHSPWSTP